MKRSTLILLLLAVVGGALVYYFEIKPGKPRDEAADASKPAFDFKREDLTSITITRAGQAINLENQNGKWMITQPLNAPADESLVNSLVSDLATARIEREIDLEGDRLKNFGLTEPTVKLEFKLKDGKQHRIEFGIKDYSGSSAYAKVDGGQKAVLLPAALLTNADKPVNELRDRSIFSAPQNEINALKVSNAQGGFELAKQENNWLLKSPVAEPADEGAVNTLLSDITSAKSETIVSETADELAKYGLNQPSVTLTTQLNTGGERVIIAAKQGDNYYAKASDRPQIFKIDSAFYDKLNAQPATLRSKEIIKLDRDNLARVQIKNPNTTITAENKDGKWVVVEPTEQKDKEALTSKLLDPLETTATEIIDKPSAAIAAKLAKPAVEARLTGKDGKATVIKVSAADGDDVYVRVEGRAGIYKVGKSMLDSLSFKLDEAVSSAQ
jgi:hypothetical protein